jgi:hypothetical protein
LGWFVTKGGAMTASPFRIALLTWPSFAMLFDTAISESLSLDSLPPTALLH